MRRSETVKKAISFCFFIVSMMVLGSILLTNPPEDLTQKTLSEESASVQDTPDLERQVANSKTQTPSQDEEILENSTPESLSKKFLDSQLPLDERLDAWTTLLKKKPLPTKSFVQIAIAPNPHEGKDLHEHSSEEREYQREESFRIMALQSLEKAILENSASIQMIDSVATQAASRVVREIASKMKEYVKKGYSYSDLVNQAVLREEVPQ